MPIITESRRYTSTEQHSVVDVSETMNVEIAGPSYILATHYSRLKRVLLSVLCSASRRNDDLRRSIPVTDTAKLSESPVAPNSTRLCRTVQTPHFTTYSCNPYTQHADLRFEFCRNPSSATRILRLAPLLLARLIRVLLLLPRKIRGT